MGRIEIRPYREEDRDAFFRVLSMSYRNGLEVPEEDREFRFERPFVGLVDGEVAGAFFLLDMNASRGTALLGCAGVQAVAVLPEHRSGGLAGEMMRWALRLLREEGTPLSSLYGFRESYYRKFGYEVAGRRVKISCPSNRLPAGRDDLPIRKLAPDDWRLIAPCYEAFAHARSGLHVRNERMWERVLNEHRPVTVYALGDPVEAYIALSPSTAAWGNHHLSEVVWSTRRGYESLFSMMERIAVNMGSLSWYEPSDGPFLARHLDQGVETQIVRPIMFRVVDVPRALRELRPRGEGEFTLRVADDLFTGNEGPWRVRFSPAGVEVGPASEAEIELDVRHFAQALLGEPSLDDLLRNGLACASGGAAEAARNLLPPLPVYCSDFF
jgi:predicted acetyltransferase